MTALRYLLVEDSPTVRLTLKKALSQEGVGTGDVSEAESARGAMDVFDEKQPDVVFMDINLADAAPTPPGSGFLDLLNALPTASEGGNDVARYMLSKNPQLTIVVCTGNPPDDPRVREMIRNGAFQILQKPVRIQQIREVVRAIQKERDDMGASPAN